MSNPQQDQKSNGTDASSNVVDFTKAAERRQEREPALTDEEIAEYRRLLPVLRMMIREREILMGQHGCPIMQGILGVV